MPLALEVLQETGADVTGEHLNIVQGSVDAHLHVLLQQADDLLGGEAEADQVRVEAAEVRLVLDAAGAQPLAQRALEELGFGQLAKDLVERGARGVLIDAPRQQLALDAQAAARLDERVGGGDR
jgi:hypothetical protein